MKCISDKRLFGIGPRLIKHFPQNFSTYQSPYHLHPKHRLSLDVLKPREINSHTSSKLKSKLF